MRQENGRLAHVFARPRSRVGRHFGTGDCAGSDVPEPAGRGLLGMGDDLAASQGRRAAHAPAAGSGSGRSSASGVRLDSPARHRDRKKEKNLQQSDSKTAMPVASTSCGEIEMLALYKGLVQATPSTRTLELYALETSRSPRSLRSTCAARWLPTCQATTASTSTREPPSRAAATSSAQRRACNRAAASAGQPPPFPKGATANPNSDHRSSGWSCTSKHTCAHRASTEAAAASPPTRLNPLEPLHSEAAPAPPAASPPTMLNSLEPLHCPPPPPPHDALDAELRLELRERRARLLAPQGHVRRRARLLLGGPHRGLPDAQVQQGQARESEKEMLAQSAGPNLLVMPILHPIYTPPPPQSPAS